ncbi:hypothetical protein [Pseudomonas sp. VI4.1]|uniref:hypothetical protein n=1 Tax=Pseudomonas sp. VI4.1 TaxID=1941346 RepID=UPI0026C06AA1
MKGKLLGAAATLAIIGAVTYGLSTWEASENPQRDEQCKIARQRVKVLEIQARALAAGLSVDGYAEAEKAEVGKLVLALDTARNEQEVEAVIAAHAATVQAQVAASDAEVNSRGRSAVSRATAQRAANPRRRQTATQARRKGRRHRL